MVYYFSGTGNSTFVAQTLGNLLSLEIKFIPQLEPKEIITTDDRVLFVFPVYSWGVPPLVIKFIEDLPESFWISVKSQDLSVDCVMTCGDETALAPEMIQKALKRKGIELNSIWSVIMPNNYVLLPGFNVDPKDLEEKKLKACEGRILEIAEGLRAFSRRTDVVRGKMAGLKSRVVYPLFKKWGIFPKKWHYSPGCIGCGRCEKICPMLNVKMENDHPKWGSRCCSCLACYHVCPVHAVEYGKDTRNKGQYLFPIKKIWSLNCHK